MLVNVPGFTASLTAGRGGNSSGDGNSSSSSSSSSATAEATAEAVGPLLAFAYEGSWFSSCLVAAGAYRLLAGLVRGDCGGCAAAPPRARTSTSACEVEVG